MAKMNMINQLGEAAGEIELNDALWNIEINEHAVYEAVKCQLAGRRRGTQSAKTRAEVRGGGRKPWRQKGTGRARQGSIRAPQWRGGGVVFAPKPRDYSYKIPKKVKRLALKSALTSKVKENEMIVLDALQLEAISTKEAVSILKNVNAARSALVVIDQKSDEIYKSFRNIPKVETILAENINVYDILKYDSFIITKAAVEKVEEVFA